MALTRIQAKVRSNAVINLPREVYGNVTVPPGTENLHFKGHPLGTKWTVKTGACIVIIGGSGNVLPPLAADPVDITDISPTGFSYDDSKGTQFAVGHDIWVYPVDELGDPIEETTVPRYVGGFRARVGVSDGPTVEFETTLANGAPTEYGTDWEYDVDLSDSASWNDYFALFQWKAAIIDTDTGFLAGGMAKNITIEGIHFQGQYKGGLVSPDLNTVPILIGAFYTDGLVIRNCKFKHAWGQHVYISRCNQVQVSDTFQQGCGTESAGSGYSIEVQQCVHAFVQRAIAERVARVVTFDGSVYGGIARHIWGWNMRGSIIDWHGGLGFGMKWFHVRQMGKPNMSFADELISLGNATHKGPCLGVVIDNCSATEIQVYNNNQVSFSNNTCFHIYSGATGGVVSTPRIIKVKAGNTIAKELLIAAVGEDTIIQMEGGTYTDAPYWGSAFVRVTYAGSHNFTLNMAGTTLVRNTQTVPHCSFAGTGTLYLGVTDCNFNGGTGLRVAIDAPGMTEGGGSVWTNNSSNGASLSKVAGVII